MFLQGGGLNNVKSLKVLLSVLFQKKRK